MATEPNGNLPATQEISNLIKAAQKDSSGFQKRLTFNGNTGVYTCDGQEVQLGTKVIAHCLSWVQEWIKFVDRQFVEKKLYRVSNGEHIPTRDQLDDQDEKFWSKGRDRKPQDPWTLRFLLPMWHAETDETMVFTTPSKSGQRAVSDLVTIYGRRAQRQPECGQPIIKLQSVIMTTSFGSMHKPSFDIVGWDDGLKPIREVSDEDLRKGDFNDEIPF